MQSIRHTNYSDKIIRTFNYDFADVFLFDRYIVSEVKTGITFSWDNHAKVIVEDITKYTESNGEDLIYLSHRIYSYSVQPMDWLKFYRNRFNLKGYGVIGYNSNSFMNTVIENLFFTNNSVRFRDLDTANQWATNKILTG
ncbi:hypothetical protein [uncultured Winogradskyella sp.]|uniref:hypothetical protein n=1 Tax=uncultured Winogradskyella sp. TaxID=395353 RepID=UPI00261B02AA|nr:hypothetical protein [uncultured Winogradskyella sp.]